MPNTTYTFEMHAITPVGAGPSVSASVTTTPSPVVVGELHFSEITMTGLKVSWTAPDAPNRNVTGYYVVYETAAENVSHIHAFCLIVIFQSRPRPRTMIVFLSDNFRLSALLALLLALLVAVFFIVPRLRNCFCLYHRSMTCRSLEMLICAFFQFSTYSFISRTPRAPY